VSTKSSQDLGNSEDVSQGNRKDSSENEGQGDRKGRPYNTTKKRPAEGVYGRGDHGGRPGSHDHHVSEGHSEILEQDLAHRWRALPLMQSLPLIDGGMCFLCYAGRSGGPQGPDIRDAVLQFALEHAGAPAERVTGDVEFHIRCSDWYAHQHHTDPRYNNVILHVVLIFDIAGPVVRHDGHAVPVCSLNDLVPAIFPQPLWPCQCIIKPTLSGDTPTFRRREEPEPAIGRTSCSITAFCLLSKKRWVVPCQLNGVSWGSVAKDGGKNAQCELMVAALLSQYWYENQVH
jgi:hypothetical protein